MRLAGLKSGLPFGVALFLAPLGAGADDHDQEPVTIIINAISDQGVGAAIGTITLTEVDGEPTLQPDVSGLAPGAHAFHIHENPDCGAAEKDGVMVAGLAAGGHYDPHAAMGHDHNHSHGDDMMPMKPAGDLHELFADEDGVARTAVTVSTLDFDGLMGRAIMIHAYPEDPEDPDLPKGGGPRFACGIIGG